jgi:beta-lactamase regulating signal transducer with metallopeptidase domain/protocatechuate 3,4-dioxygenase beta subunit
MNGLSESVALWLADYLLLASVLLLIVLAAFAALAQPVQRLAVTKAVLFSLVLVALLCALPGWSVVHLLTAENRAAHDAMPSSNRSHRPDSGRAPDQSHTPADDSTITRAIAAPTAPAAIESSSWSDLNVPTVAVTIFFFGSALILLWLAYGAIAARRLRRGSAAAEPELAELFHRIAGEPSPSPALLLSNQIDTAIALGIWRPAVILPLPWTAKKSGDELTSVLAHEWAHVRNGDLKVLALSRALLILLWVQPLYWLLRRRMRLDQEALADAAAADAAGRQQYAAELVAWARTAARRPRMPAAAAVGLWEGPSQLRRRIAILLDERFTVLRACSFRWRAATMTLLVGAALGLSLVTMQPQSAAQPTANTVQQTQPANSPAGREQESDAVFIPFSGGWRMVQESVQRPSPNTISGSLRDENNQPLAGVEVSVYRVDESDETRELVGSKKTAADGSFEFAAVVDMAKEYPNGLPPTENARFVAPRYVVVARSPGRATLVSIVMPVRWVAEHGLRIEGLMKPAATLRGRVTAEDGSPIDGALVAISPPSQPRWEGAQAGRTDANGNYVIDDAPAFDLEAQNRKEQAEREARLARSTEPQLFIAEPRTVVATHPEFAQRIVQHENIPGTVDIQMQPGATITGRVVNGASGEPLAGINLLASRKRPPPQPQSAPPKFEARAFEYMERLATTGAGGQYRFPQLIPDEYLIRVESDEWAQPQFAQVNAAAKTSTTAPDIRLTNGGTIRVQVVDAATGEPLTRLQDAFAFLYATPTAAAEAGRGGISRRSELDPQGRLEFQHVAGEFVHVSVLVQQGSQRWDSDRITIENERIKYPLVVKDGETIDLRLHVRKLGDPNGAANPQRQQATIVGQCTDENFRGLAQVEASLYLVEPPDGVPQLIARTTSGSGGTFRFSYAAVEEKRAQTATRRDERTEKADDAMLVVVAKLAGHATVRQHAPIKPIVDGEIVLPFEMKPAATIRGRVTGPSGQPVAGAVVSMGTAAYETVGGQTATTDADGRYEISDAEPYDRAEIERQQREAARQALAAYSLFTAKAMKVTHSSYADAIVRCDKIPGTKDIKLQPPAPIRGRVLLGESGEPGRGVVVAAARSKVSPGMAALMDDVETHVYQMQSVRTDADGRYEFATFPAGEYDIWPESDEWVHRGLGRLETSAGRPTAAPDMVLSRGGTLRVEFIDSATGKAIPSEGSLEAFASVMPMPKETALSRRQFIHHRKALNEDGRLEIRLHPGEFSQQGVTLFKDGQPAWGLVPPPPTAQPQGDDKSNRAAFVVKEGETTEVTWTLQPMGVTPTVPPAAPPVQDAK